MNGRVAGLLILGFLGGPAAAVGAITPAGLDAAARYSAERQGDALLVVQGGREVYAAGQNAFDLNRPHLLASGSKSFACGVAAALQDAGQLTLDERVADTLPQWRADPMKREVTVRQLLGFTSGLPGNVGSQMARANTDLYGQAVSTPLDARPGERFSYGNAHLAVFGAWLERRTGLNPQALYDRVLFGPLGMHVTWGLDRQGHPNLAGSASTTARDWARYGQLILNGGQWQSRQVVSGGSLQACFQGSAALNVYGLTWWLNAPVRGTLDAADTVPVRALGVKGDRLMPSLPQNVVMAAGLGNQRLYVLPDQDAVVVRFASGGPWNDDEFLRTLLNLPPAAARP